MASGTLNSNYKLQSFSYSAAICNSSATDPNKIDYYFPNLQNGSYIVIIERSGYVWSDCASVYLCQRDGNGFYSRFVIKEGSGSNCPKMNTDFKVYLSATSSYGIGIHLLRYR